MSLQSSLFFVARLPGEAAILLLRIYQWVVSPMKAALFGQAATCRFYPTCSQYAVEAIRERGFWFGIGLTAVRLAKCHPFHPGGYDPVRPRCRHEEGPEERDLPLEQK